MSHCPVSVTVESLQRGVIPGLSIAEAFTLLVALLQVMSSLEVCFDYVAVIPLALGEFACEAPGMDWGRNVVRST